MILDHAATLPPAAYVETIKGAATYEASVPLNASDQPTKQYAAGKPVWEQITQRNFAAIKELSDGWDGPRSKGVGRSTIYFADRLLRDTFREHESVSAPYIIPAPDGSIQFQWRTNQYELEFTLAESGHSSFWLLNRESGAELEREGDKAIDMLFRWAPRVAAVADDARDVGVSSKAELLLVAA